MLSQFIMFIWKYDSCERNLWDNAREGILPETDKETGEQGPRGQGDNSPLHT